MKHDIRYWKMLAAFSYASYLEHGDGAVLIKEQPSQPFSPADLDKHFQYIPFNPDNDDLPMDAVEMITEYDPEKEVILMIVDAKGQTVCLQLSAEKLGVTPLEAYQAIHGKFVPGAVYQLTQAIDAVQPGYYIYEREEKASLVFCRMGMDEDEGDVCKTDEVIRVHRDFRDYYIATQMKVGVE